MQNIFQILSFPEKDLLNGLTLFLQMKILNEAAFFCTAYIFTWPINYQLQSNHFCCAAALHSVGLPPHSSFFACTSYRVSIM